MIGPGELITLEDCGKYYSFMLKNQKHYGQILKVNDEYYRLVATDINSRKQYKFETHIWDITIKEIQPSSKEYKMVKEIIEELKIKIL